MTISFPGLGIGEFSMERVAFRLFGKPIYWYGVIICIGLLLALAYGMLNAEKSGISKDDLLDIALVAIPSAIVAARLFYVLTDSQIQKSFYEIVAVWDGGISIIGTIIGGIISVFIACLVKKLNFLKVTDLLCRCLIVGQIVGRLGNFVNVEVYGIKTDLPWGMYIDRLGYAVHPLFAYEMLWNLLGFVILILLARKKAFDGEVFFTYTAWYGLGRAALELLRDKNFVLNNYISHMIAAVAFFVSCILLVILAVNNARKKAQLLTEEENGKAD